MAQRERSAVGGEAIAYASHSCLVLNQTLVEEINHVAYLHGRASRELDLE